LLDLTPFLDYLKKIFPNMSQKKLRMNINFMILGATDQKLWVFEVFRRSLGKVGMYWSQPTRVDHMRRKCKARGKKNSKKWE
jgi:hypothetical protein